MDLRWFPVAFAPAAFAAVILLSWGRVPWCKCASPVPWSFDIWTLHNSQHLVDPYSFTHILHGVAFYGLLAGVHHLTQRAAGVSIDERWRWIAAGALESAWECVENTDAVIQRYREATISLDYFGDSVANSMSDVVMCLSGFALASRLPWWGSLLFFAVVELILVGWIRDSLVINVVMLVYPIDALKNWQAGG